MLCIGLPEQLGELCEHQRALASPQLIVGAAFEIEIPERVIVPIWVRFARASIETEVGSGRLREGDRRDDGARTRFTAETKLGVSAADIEHNSVFGAEQGMASGDARVGRVGLGACGRSDARCARGGTSRR